MGITRDTIIEALRQDPPDVAQALDLLTAIEPDSLTPDAITLRQALLDAAGMIDNKVGPYDLAQFLRDSANGRLAILDDHEIDVDLPEDGEGTPFAALMGPHRAPSSGPTLPGPDSCLLDALRQRDALVARRIAGDSPSNADVDAYQQALIALGKALAPLVEADRQQVGIHESL